MADVSTERDVRSTSPLSEPQENASSPLAGNRRKSGRATRKPELFSLSQATQDNAGTGGRPKRKRVSTQQDEENDEEDEGEEEVDEDGQDASDSDEGESDGDPDEEELKEKKRKTARRTSSQKKKKPNEKTKSRGPRAAKKPKITNGMGTELAIRPAVNGKKVASKPKRSRARPILILADEDGLFGTYPFSIRFPMIMLTYQFQLRFSHEAIQLKPRPPNG